MKRLRANGPWFSGVLIDVLSELGLVYRASDRVVINTNNVGPAGPVAIPVSSITREFLTSIATKVDSRHEHFNDVSIAQMRVALSLKEEAAVTNVNATSSLTNRESAMAELNARLMKHGAPECTSIEGWTLRYVCASSGKCVIAEHNGSNQGATIRSTAYVADHKMNRKRKSDKGAAVLVVSLLDELKRIQR
jgi:hypothetical protein